MVIIKNLPLTMQNKLAGIGLLVILGAVWGSSFILMKLGMEPVQGFPTMNHFQVAGLRMTIAAVVMLPFAIRSIKLLKTKSAPYLLIVGLCGNFIPSYLFTYAGTGLSSGFWASLIALLLFLPFLLHSLHLKPKSIGCKL